MRDLRKQPVEDVLSHVENSLNLRLDRQTLVRKRRSLGARTNRGTWVRIEARPLAKITAQGQAGNGMEAAARLHGIAKPAWFTAVSWHDSPGQAVWRADEVELVTAAPVRSSGPLGSDVELSDEWWILDWEDHGLAPRGLDAATLWLSSLTVPTLAERVYRERRADLETRSGKLMALFHCAKVLNDSGASTDPVFELAAREAAKLVADLQR